MLKDVLDFWEARPKLRQAGNGGGHILTGPIYVEDAAPGDMLEVQILDADAARAVRHQQHEPRMAACSVPDTRDAAKEGDRAVSRCPNGSTPSLIEPGQSRRPAKSPFFADDDPGAARTRSWASWRCRRRHRPWVQPGVTVPLECKAPHRPRLYGGNMNMKDLHAGTKLYLPVFHPGGLFYAGDPHGAQGMAKSAGPRWSIRSPGCCGSSSQGEDDGGPRAETATTTPDGDRPRLDRAMRLATAATVQFLVEEKKLTPAKALSLCKLCLSISRSAKRSIWPAARVREDSEGAVPEAVGAV